MCSASVPGEQGSSAGCDNRVIVTSPGGRSTDECGVARRGGLGRHLSGQPERRSQQQADKYSVAYHGLLQSRPRREPLLSSNAVASAAGDSLTRTQTYASLPGQRPGERPSAASSD